jgi:Fe-S oxidoreductase
MDTGLHNVEPIEEKSFLQEPEGSQAVMPDRQFQFMQRALKKNLSRQILFMMKACVNCGICAEACHFYCSTSDPEVIPVNKFRKLSLLLRRYFDPVSSRLPFLKGIQPPDDTELSQLFKAAYEDCTLCGKCALSCPLGINTGEMMFLARAMLCSVGQLPSGLVDPVKAAFKVGNYLGLSTQDFIENIEWIAEEMEDDIGQENFSIPIDRQGAAVLYIPHPLEARDLPFLLMDAVKILHTAQEDYTFSSYDFDTVNYAYYQGSKENMMRIAGRLLEARQMLGAKSIALAPCGHGYRVMRWEVEKYLGKRFSFSVLAIVELIERYITTGRIQMEKNVFEGPVTFHDPCNVARRGGVIQAPRNILKALTSEFIEMQPNGARNYCCGGGGGLASTADYGQIRINNGKTKADQIRRTGAKIVATNCFNCMTQIRDLNKAYDLGIEVKSIVELVAGSLKS